jgi:hypothetical protein
MINLLAGQQTAAPMMAQAGMPQNVLSEAMRPRRATNIERNPTTPLEDTVRPRPKFHQVLGRVGDIMAMMGGRDPLFERYAAMEQAQAAQAEQQNAFAKYFQPGGGLEEYAPLAQAGVGLPDIMKLAELRQPQGMKGPETIQLMQIARDPNRSMEERQSAQAILNNRAAAGLMEGSPDTGYRLSEVFQPINLLGGDVGVAPQQPQATAQQPQVVQQPAGNEVTMQDLQVIAQSMNGNRDQMMRWMKNNKVVVRVSTLQDAANLPPGTEVITPDGRKGTVK